MAMRNMAAGVPKLFKGGTQHLSGLEQAVLRNIEACEDLAHITRTSLGPNGMNKMVINHIEKLFVTSDSATILREMEIVHPAARLIVLASHMQEVEVGDGSNLVIVLVGALLHQAARLIRMGLHPREIIDGYTEAGKTVQTLLDELVVKSVEGKEVFNEGVLAEGVHAAVAAKQYGYEEFLSNLIAEATLAVMPQNTHNFNVDNVRVVKLVGGSLLHSEVVRGMVIPRPPLGTTREMKDAKIAVFTCAFDASQTETKGTVKINNAEELLNYNESEEKHIHDLVRSIAETGVNMVVSGGSTGEMALHFANKYNIMLVRTTSKFMLRRICRAVGARPLVALQPPQPDDIGYCSRVYTREFGENRATIFALDKKDKGQVATIVLRGSTSSMLNDVEKAIDDGVNVVRQMGRDARFVAGAGACEIELARRLHQVGESKPGLEQYAIKAFGDALECVPRTLAENAGLDEMKMVSELYAAHEAKNQRAGIDIEGRCVKDMTEQKIYDLLPTKSKAIKLAADTAITILRVDQIIMAKRAGGPKLPKQAGHWDDTD